VVHQKGQFPGAFGRLGLFGIQYMEKHRFNAAVLPGKEDNYRGARKHTSEVRHTFVCHAEWMLKYSSLHKGAVSLSYCSLPSVLGYMTV
jgi:hypothetical protein